MMRVTVTHSRFRIHKLQNPEFLKYHSNLYPAQNFAMRGHTDNLFEESRFTQIRADASQGPMPLRPLRAASEMDRRKGPGERDQCPVNRGKWVTLQTGRFGLGNRAIAVRRRLQSVIGTRFFESHSIGLAAP